MISLRGTLRLGVLCVENENAEIAETQSAAETRPFGVRSAGAFVADDPNRRGYWRLAEFVDEIGVAQ